MFVALFYKPGKVYDRLWRHLWRTLIKSGVPGRCLKAINALYEKGEAIMTVEGELAE